MGSAGPAWRHGAGMDNVQCAFGSRSPTNCHGKGGVAMLPVHRRKGSRPRFVQDFTSAKIRGLCLAHLLRGSLPSFSVAFVSFGAKCIWSKIQRSFASLCAALGTVKSHKRLPGPLWKLKPIGSWMSTLRPKSATVCSVGVLRWPIATLEPRDGSKKNAWLPPRVDRV